MSFTGNDLLNFTFLTMEFYTVITLLIIDVRKGVLGGLTPHPET